jgi:pimeloyl-ACP methyl ester carboxylesterase
MKDIAKGNNSAKNCFGTDPKQKFASTAAGATEDYQESCVGVDSGSGLARRPDFGAASVATMIERTQSGTETILSTLFGDDLNAALPVGNPDKDTNKCQQGVMKAAKKCHEAAIKLYNKCEKSALKAGADGADALASCLATDADVKLAKACNLNETVNGKLKTDKIRKILSKKCVGVDLSTAFPGCGINDVEAVHACIEPTLDCVSCTVIGFSNDVENALDCDTHDNGAVDGSCLEVSGLRFTTASSAQPAETPGSPGVTVTNPDIITQLGSSADLNVASYTRWRAAGPEQQPDAIVVLIGGFGGGANNFKMMAEDLIPKVLADHGFLIEVWGFHRRSNQLEDRAGSQVGIDSADATLVLNWYYGDDLGFAMPETGLTPARRAIFYNKTDAIPFIANWTTQTHSLDIDTVVEVARATAANGNVYLGGHSAGTGFTARYAATDLNLTGVGPADPAYAKLRGLIMLEGTAGSTGGDPLSSDSLDRMIAQADGGMFAAVRDAAPRCVDGTTACTVATEAIDCLGLVPPVCTQPQDAYAAVGGLSPQVTASSEPMAVQGLLDPNTGQAILQADQGAPGNNAIAMVPELGLLNLLGPSTSYGLFGQFLDDDGLAATLLTASIATSLGEPGSSIPVQKWNDYTKEPFDPANIPDNGPAPTTLPAGVWGQEREVVSIDRYRTTFAHAGQNAADWYYATSGLNTTVAAGTCGGGGTCSTGNVGAACTDDSDCRQAISLDSSALSIGRNRPDIVNLTQAASIDIPVILIGGSNGLTSVPGVWTPFASSIGTCAAPSCDGTPRVVNATVPNEAFPTLGDVDGGFEAHIIEGLAHNDVTSSEDLEGIGILDRIGDFIARNNQ